MKNALEPVCVNGQIVSKTLNHKRNFKFHMIINELYC